MDSNAYVKSMQALGKAFINNFEESWLDAKVDGFKIRIANQPEDDKFYTSGTLLIEPEKPGYEFKYRDGKIYSNRTASRPGVYSSGNREVLGITENFMNGFARVKTQDEGEKILLLGNYVLPVECAKKVSAIYYDFKEFLTIDAKKDCPFDPKHPRKTPSFYAYAYQNVLIHGLTEMYCSLRDDFARAKTIEERAIIYGKTKTLADEIKKYDPLFEKKREELIGLEQPSFTASKGDGFNLNDIFDMIRDLVNFDKKDFSLTKNQVKNLIEEKEYVTNEIYLDLQKNGQDMSKFTLLPNSQELDALLFELFKECESAKESDVVQEAIFSLAGISSSFKMSKTQYFKDLISNAGVKDFEYFKSKSFDAFFNDLYNALFKLGYNASNPTKRLEYIKKINPLSWETTTKMLNTYDKETIKLLADAVIEEYNSKHNGDDSPNGPNDGGPNGKIF